MTATGEVNFNGIVMRGFGGPPRPGFYFINLTDWYSLPNAKTEIRERPLADGAFGFSADYRQAATVSLDGVYLATDRLDLQQARSALMEAARGASIPLTFTDESGPTTRQVNVRALPVADDHGKLYFTFSIDTLSVDPNRYASQPPGLETVSTGLPAAGSGVVWKLAYPITWGTPSATGRVTVHNLGTAPSYTIMQVTGGLSGGFILTNVTTGDMLRLDRAVPLGSTVLLNPRTGRATIDGLQNDISGFLTSRQWWSIPSESSQDIQFTAIGAPTGTPTLTATTASAY
jgi:hypothetical protein